MKENVERCGATAVMVMDRWGNPVDPEKQKLRSKPIPTRKSLPLSTLRPLRVFEAMRRPYAE